MEAGGKISARNERSISPVELLPPIARLQKQLVADCWLGIVLEDAAHLNEQSEQGKVYTMLSLYFLVYFLLINAMLLITCYSYYLSHSLLYHNENKSIITPRDLYYVEL
jgi:hypothetical protein